MGNVRGIGGTGGVGPINTVGVGGTARSDLLDCARKSGLCEALHGNREAHRELNRELNLPHISPRSHRAILVYLEATTVW